MTFQQGKNISKALHQPEQRSDRWRAFYKFKV